MTPSAPRIGIDFDNTLIRYDRVFLEVGRECGLLPADFQGGKPEIRAHVRSLPGGADLWTALQGRVYGPGVERAEPAEGALAFLAACRRSGMPTAIISHKTEFAVADPGGVNLRAAARAWIDRHGLTDPLRGGVDPDAVFFEDTRAAKIGRIVTTGSTHFIDDLEEVFLEPLFPAGVDRCLLLHDAGTLPVGPYRAFRSWAEITNAFFAQT
ncbi:hypothetical protein [Azospirillum sp. TSO5]|uniref:hypothetical protein n=1 Tax=Azospirillum sp. TSO5 TaxID=716760 RepID=UPI000D64E046|nr:hypothetical protein [Azospirillum sp. TSO5]